MNETTLRTTSPTWGRHAREEGTVDRIPVMLEGVDEEEVMRLTLKASHEQPPLPPQALPRYVATIMSADISIEGGGSWGSHRGLVKRHARLGRSDPR
jgi:hypothetical protein